MPDNLRDRIAAVIDGIRIQRDGDSYKMADAVIRGLGLRAEHDAIDHTDNQPASHRYVTEWETDV